MQAPVASVATKITMEDGRFIIERVQDVEPYLDANRHLRGEPKKFAEDMRLIASIPNVVLERWINESGVNLLKLPKREFAAFVKRKLNDPDWAYLKTVDGRI